MNKRVVSAASPSISTALASLIGACAIVVIASVMLTKADRSYTPVVVSDIASMLAGDEASAFARARRGNAVAFPRDHGPHPAYRIEWWYFTGNLAAESGRRFGYQVTFFRQAMSPNRPALDSNFASNQSWMAHVALTDMKAGRFLNKERFSRDAPNLAGARAEPFMVWLENWQVTARASDRCSGCLDFVLDVDTGNFALKLELGATRNLVLQGDRGFSPKSHDERSASHYYSMTRLASTGSVRVDQQSYSVTGTSWLDREWSSSNLGQHQSGWDWFALQLDNGDDLMVYRLRAKDSSTSSVYAVLVNAGGRYRDLHTEQLSFEPLRYWRSEASSTRYPVEWRLTAGDLTLTVSSVLDAQEHDGLFRYWEGAVRVSGDNAGSPVTGVGYLEMTGYSTP